MCVWFLNVYCITIYFDWQNAAWIGSFISTEHRKRSSSALNGLIQSMVPPPRWEAPIYQNECLPPFEGRTTQRQWQHKGLQHLKSVSLSLTKTFARKWCRSRRRKKCYCSSLITKLRGSLCSDDLFSRLSKQSQCGMETWRMTRWEIRGTICLILEELRKSIHVAAG